MTKRICYDKGEEIVRKLNEVVRKYVIELRIYKQ